MDVVFDHWRLLSLVAATVLLAICYRFVLWLFGVIIVPDDAVGVVTKKFVISGANRSLMLADVVDVPDDKVGVVMTREGTPLAAGEIAGPTAVGHPMFHNPQAFVEAGCSKGLQEQVLLAGRYFINPRFATVELADMVEVPSRPSA